MSLASMLSGNWFEALATATPATSATEQGKQGRSVATVATVAVANPQNKKAANDLAAPAGIAVARLALFKSRGASADTADNLVQLLTRRDAEGDDRRVCLECRHMYGTVERSRCSQSRKLWHGDPSMPCDMVATLQRCAGFVHRIDTAISPEKVATLKKFEGLAHAENRTHPH